MYSKMQGRGRFGGNGLRLVTPVSSMTTTSPFSMSRTNFAPMMSSAQVSEVEDRAAVELAEHERADAERDRARRSSFLLVSATSA